MRRVRHRNGRAAPGNASGTRPEPGYNVGYGKPPQARQFRPGESGNPKGRPKGSKNTATLLRELLDRKIEMRTGDSIRKVTVREAILTRFADSALKGDRNSAAFLLQRYDLADVALDPVTNDTTPDEQEIISEWLKTNLKKKDSE
jgi:Family of unknown function (DUF5681)